MATQGWPNSNDALREVGRDLTNVDRTRIDVRRLAISTVTIGGFTAGAVSLVLVGAEVLNLGTAGLIPIFMVSLLGGLWGVLAAGRRSDAALARHIRALAAQRRNEAQAARTIGALGASSAEAPVAVPGIVDERVRDARR
jgi:hypothetical protein